MSISIIPANLVTNTDLFNWVRSSPDGETVAKRLDAIKNERGINSVQELAQKSMNECFVKEITTDSISHTPLIAITSEIAHQILDTQIESEAKRELEQSPFTSSLSNIEVSKCTELEELLEKDIKDFKVDDFENLHKWKNQPLHNEDYIKRINKKQEELRNKINSILWSKESQTQFYEFICGQINLGNCKSFACVHNTLINLQIDGAKTANGTSPFSVYKEHVKEGGVINYFQALGFDNSNRLMNYNSTYDEELSADEEVEKSVTNDLKKIDIPEYRIFCANMDPNIHTWFANRSGKASEAIFTSLNSGQTPAVKDTNLLDIMQSDLEVEYDPLKAYGITSTLFSDKFCY